MDLLPPLEGLYREDLAPPGLWEQFRRNTNYRKIDQVDGVLLTHAHLDHSGAVPIFHIQERKPVIGTRLTFELAQLLIADFIHLSGYYLPFEYLELRLK
jgi:Cft2 family RNA processing exonuclease